MRGLRRGQKAEDERIGKGTQCEKLVAEYGFKHLSGQSILGICELEKKRPNE